MINSSANEHVHSLVRLTIEILIPLIPRQYSTYFLFFISCCLFPVRGGVKVPLVGSGD